MAPELREIEQRMAMARPWDYADDGSLWEITGGTSDGKFTFDRCLAMCLVEPTAVPDPSRCFVLIPAGRGAYEFIPPAWVHRGMPLMLVHRDDPTRRWAP